MKHFRKQSRRQAISVLSLFVLMFSLMPALSVRAAVVPLITSATFHAGDTVEVLVNGQKGINSASLSAIELFYEAASYKLKADSELGRIQVLANYAEDETYKFMITSNGSEIVFSLKNQPSGSRYTLREHAIYDVILPGDAFSPALEKETHFNFVTAGCLGRYKNDILLTSDPEDGAVSIDNTRETIAFSFIEDIGMDEAVKNNIGDYITLQSECLAPGIPGYELQPSTPGDDSLVNYSVSVDKNRLILQAKAEKLKDFACYTVKLKKQAIYLKKPFLDSGLKIYNESQDGGDWETVSFSTGTLLQTSYPLDYQEGLEINPLLSLTFKYPIEIIDSSQITLQATDGTTWIFAAKDILSQDGGSTLQLTIDPVLNHFPLTRSTYYTLTIPQGAIRLKDYPLISGKVLLHFTTSSEGSSPVLLSYRSDINGSDDIRGLETSQLNDGDSIYITFNTPIQWSKQAETMLARDRASLYRMPHLEETGYDYLAKDYGRIAKFKQISQAAPLAAIVVPDLLGIDDDAARGKLEDCSTMDRVPLATVEISPSNPKVLKITPLKPVSGMTKYKLIIDQNMIEDAHGYKLDRDVEAGVWAKASITAPVANWIGPEGLEAGQVVDNSQGVNKSYIVKGAPRYNSDTKPLELSLKGEVVWKAQDKVSGSGALKNYIISYDSFKSILLQPSYSQDNPVVPVALNKFEMEYYFVEGQKYSRIRIYPAAELEPGTNYTLTIPAETFSDRGGRSPGMLTEQFTTIGSSTDAAQAIKLDKSSFSNQDFYDASEDIYILGSNFTPDNRAMVQLVPSGGNVLSVHPEPIILGGSGYDDAIPLFNDADLYFQSNERLRLNISGEMARKFSADDYVGTYAVGIKFSKNSAVSSDIGVFTILSKGKPVLISKSPDSSSTWYDQNAINPMANVYGQTRYFIKLTYRDDESALQINETDLIQRLKRCSVCAEGGSQASMVDQDLLDTINKLNESEKTTAINQYLFTKDPVQKLAYLNIPIKILRSQSKYSVTISDNIVYFSSGLEGNASLSWSFTTLSVPLVSGVTPCSVGEDYGNNEFIIVTGDFFYQGQGGLRVRFSTGNDTDAVSSSWMADRVEAVTVEGKLCLKVYLPYNGERLKKGTYNVTVLNGEQHKETLYGAFSVISRASRPLPADGQGANNAFREGDVIASINRSSSSLKLSSRYTNRSFVELNMDELLGQDVWERKITIEPRKKDRIGELRTISSWASVSFFGVQYAGSSRDNPPEIRVGRATPVQARSLQSKLGRQQGLHSEIIEATVEGLAVDVVSLSIPFRNSDGQNLQAMYYDPFLRKWQQVPSQINWVDRYMSISGARPGFFAIVNGGGI